MSATTIIRHTCTDTGRALPFGRLAPEGECVRCDQRRGGAPARKWRSGGRMRTSGVDQRASGFRAHLASEAHKACTVCTFGDW